MPAKPVHTPIISQRQHAPTASACMEGGGRPAPFGGLSRDADSPVAYRVLVIEPSPTIRTILRVCLGRAGFLVFDFPDGVEALRWFHSPQAVPLDVALVETDLPTMDWLTLIRHVKGHPACAHMTLLMLSSRDGVLDRLKARVAGARGYVVKPFRTQDLLREVQRSLVVPETQQILVRQQHP